VSTPAPRIQGPASTSVWAEMVKQLHPERRSGDVDTNGLDACRRGLQAFRGSIVKCPVSFPLRLALASLLADVDKAEKFELAVENIGGKSGEEVSSVATAGTSLQGC